MIFVKDPKKALVFPKRFQKGQAVEVLAQQMNLKNPETG